MRRLYNIMANRFNVYPGKIHRPLFSWGATAQQRYRGKFANDASCFEGYFSIFARRD